MPVNLVFTAVAPTVIQLASASPVTIDASQGNDFRVTLTGGTTFDPPLNPADGQVISVVMTQDGSGSHNATWDSSGFDVGSSGNPGQSSAAGSSTIVTWKYVASVGKWCFMAVTEGF
jgi:hypothetical protein